MINKQLKQQLRGLAKQCFAAMPNKHKANALINHRLINLLPATGIIGTYHALPHEPLLDLLAFQPRLALPVVVARDAPLEYRLWQGALSPDVMGIPAPNGAAVLPNVVLVPCLGFTKTGYRLGSGGGYYDRTFASWQHKPLLIGVAYACQLLDFTPAPHDWRLDMVITE
jgi:5-formyltetrahydrofolate cyclo-ligase